MLDRQVRSLEQRVARATASEIGCGKANPPELLLDEHEEFSRATAAPEDSRLPRGLVPVADRTRPCPGPGGRREWRSGHLMALQPACNQKQTGRHRCRPFNQKVITEASAGSRRTPAATFFTGCPSGRCGESKGGTS